MIDIGHSAYSQFAKLKGEEELDDFGEDDDDDLKQFFKGKSDVKATNNNNKVC